MTNIIKLSKEVTKEERARYYNILRNGIRNDAGLENRAFHRKLFRLFLIDHYGLYLAAYENKSDYFDHEVNSRYVDPEDGGMARSSYFRYMEVIGKYVDMGLPVVEAISRSAAIGASELLLGSGKPENEILEISQDFGKVSPQQAVERVKDEVGGIEVYFTTSPVDGYNPRWTKNEDDDLGTLEFYLSQKDRQDGKYGEPVVTTHVIENVSWAKASWLLRGQTLDCVEGSMPF